MSRILPLKKFFINWRPLESNQDWISQCRSACNVYQSEDINWSGRVDFNHRMLFRSSARKPFDLEQKKRDFSETQPRATP